MSQVTHASEIHITKDSNTFLCFLLLENSNLIVYDNPFKNKILFFLPLTNDPCSMLEIRFVRARPPIKYSSYCKVCKLTFGYHHFRYICSRCRESFCYYHLLSRIELPSYSCTTPQYVCDSCLQKTMDELSEMSIISPFLYPNGYKTLASWDKLHLPSIPFPFFFAVKTLEQELWFSCNSLSSIETWTKMIRSVFKSLPTKLRKTGSLALSAVEEKQLIQPKSSFEFTSGEKVAFYNNITEQYYTGTIIRKRFKDSSPLHEFEVAVDGQKEPLIFKSNELYKFFNKKIKWSKGKVLGYGGHAKIYEGLNLDSGESIAIKEIHINLDRSKFDKLKKVDCNLLISEISPEVSIMQCLNHPNLIKLLGFDISADSSTFYILMEVVSGGSIQSLLKQYGKFTEPVVKNFTKQILEGLNYLHKNRIVHRDVNCNNILVTASGLIKIADLGISKRLRDVLSNSSDSNLKTMVGTSRFIAPEVIVEENGYGRKADIWSLGCTVINMITGNPPFSHLSPVAALYAIGEGNRPEIPDYVSPSLKDFILKCLTRDKNQRPSSDQLLLHPWFNE